LLKERRLFLRFEREARYIDIGERKRKKVGERLPYIGRELTKKSKE